MDRVGGSWKLVKRNVIPHALPAQPAPLRVRQSVAVGDGLWWCGDHRDTASIQGALVSGRRTAEQIVRNARDQLLSDHRKTARQAAKPPIVQAVRTKNMCQCSQLPAGSKAAILEGSSTERKP